MTLKRRTAMAVLALTLAMGMAGFASGADGSWTKDAAGNWSATNNWAGGTLADGAGNTGWFTNNITAARTVTIDVTNRTLGVLNIGDADGTFAFTLAAAAPVRLMFHNNGSNAQINQTATSKGDTISAPMALTDSVDIVNASTNLLTISGTITSLVTGARALSNTGTGDVTLGGIIGNGVGSMAVIQNSDTSLLTLSGANTFTGGLFIKSGMVHGLAGIPAAFGAGLITLGDTAGSANATLRGGYLGTYANPIAIASNNTGMAAITDTANSTFTNLVTLYSHDLTLSNGGASWIVFSGGLAGRGNLILSAPGAQNVTLQTLPVNIVGAITNAGSGAGAGTISGGVGSNVTALVENSTNSALSIITLPLEVNTNGTTLININTGGVAKLTVSGGVKGIGDLVLKNNSAIGDGITLLTTAITNTGRIVNSGTGPSNTLISAIIGTNVSAVIQNSGTSPLTLSGANTFTSGVFIKSGTVNGATAAAFGTGPVTVGDITGSASATLNGALAGTFANPIAVASNNTGIAVITDSAASIFSGGVTLNSHDLTLSASAANLTLSGGLTGKGNLALNATGAGAITLSTAPVNLSGTITNMGAGSARVTIGGGVGSNVTAITEFSSSSALGITNLTVNGAGTTLANNNAGGSALLTLAGSVGGIGDLVLNNNSAITNGITLSAAAITNTGRIVNSGTGPGNTLISAVIGANASVVQNSGTSLLILSGANTYSGGTTIASGNLMITNTTGSATGPGAVNVNNGGTLLGIGTIQGMVTNNNGGTLAPGFDGTPGGTLTLGSLTWNGGGVYKCEIGSLANNEAGTGVDYDQIIVTNSLTAVPGGSNLVIRLDSLGQTLAFETNKNYSLKLITCGKTATLNPADVTLDTNAFLAGGTWVVTNLNNAIYAVCWGEAPDANKNYWRGTGNWSTATNWSLGHAPLSGEDVVFDLIGAANCSVDQANNNLGSLTLAAGYTGTVMFLTKYPGQGTFTNVAIAGNCAIQGGALTHTNNANSETFRLAMTIGGNLTVAAGGAIKMDNKGYFGSGPGYVGNYASCSHGGKGTGEAPTYGSITAPMNLGSGTSANFPNCGGGAARLEVAGTTTVFGVISASDMASGGYGSSGGSVFLTTAALTGTGTIRANSQSGGGGGRVAVIVTNSTNFGAVSMQAYGGSNDANDYGAAGTVYLEHKDHLPGHGKLIVDNNDFTTGNTYFTRNPAVRNTLQNGRLASSYEFAEIVLTNGAVYALDTNDTLIVTNTVLRGDPTDRNDGIYVAGGTLVVPEAFGFTNCYIAIGHTNSMFSPTQSLTVGSNATMKFDVPWTVNYPVTLESGGWLSHSPNDASGSIKLNLTLNAGLDVKAGGQVNVDNMGYLLGGPGYSGYYKAASHGGLGTGYNPTYGSVTAPTSLGCGSVAQPERGGGAARLLVAGTTIMNGVISASDMGANAYGNSGGSVFLTTGVLTGNGIIRANGRVTGGGGRVAVILTNSTDFGIIGMQAYGGTSGGAAGTVYKETMANSPGQGTLVIDNNNIIAVPTTLISSQVTDAVVGTVIITNKAILAVNTNQTLLVRGSWTNSATFIARTNSTVEFASANPATIAGSNAFYNLIITNAGKVVSFEAGKTNLVNGLLKLGATIPDSPVTLQSTVDGSWWYLNLTPNAGGTQQIARVTVKDSHAGGGQQLIAGKWSIDGGHNINWKFPKNAGMVIILR